MTVFLTHACETVTAHYERTLYPVGGELRADPRISHDLVLAVDDTATRCVPHRPVRPPVSRSGPERRRPRCRTDAQADAYVNGYTNPVELPDAHRTPMRPKRAHSRSSVCARAASPRSWTGHAQTRQAPARQAPAGQGTGGQFGLAELRHGLAAIRAELPFQDWDADPASMHEPATLALP